MSDELSEGVEPKDNSGLSRRNALKAGVAVGVGAAAWSGASISSLGGTPAYAAGCTGIILLNLSGRCRNVDKASNCTTTPTSTFRYHTLNAVPAPFSLDNNPIEGTCSAATLDTVPVLHWTTPNLQCVVHTEVWSGLQSCKNRPPLSPDLEFSSTNTGSNGTTGVTVPMGCGTAPVDPNTFYTIFAICGTPGFPPDCGGPPAA